MLYPKSPVFNRLLDATAKVPVIDCHEHMRGPEILHSYREPIAALLLNGYFLSDLITASFGIPVQVVERLADPSVSTDEKWPTFEKLWRMSEHTGYARMSKLVFKNVYGESEMSRAAIDRMAEKLGPMDEATYFKIIDEANIQALLVDVLGWPPIVELERFLDGRKTFPAKWRPMISLPGFHPTGSGYQPIGMNELQIRKIGQLVNRHITSLDEYLEAVYLVFQMCIERGAIGIKDQSAYNRPLAYDLVSNSEAAKQFNQLLINPGNILGWPEGKLLNDFLFHQYMRFARDLKLTVQLHTGFLFGNYNRLDNTNAALLAPLLELHREVRFDLFHGNWPYLGDLLFLGKHYPNVALDLCWLHIIDPAYAIEMMERAVLTMPHTKIHAFGGDCGDSPEFVAASLSIARQNISAALTNLVEGGWLEEEQAFVVAKDWLFNNPNRFFNLGFEEI